MKHLLNTLYVTTPGRYLSLDGENVVIREDEKEIARFPLHNFDGIVSFGYTGASPALMGACADRGLSLTFLTPSGRFLARVCGRSHGNVLLRRTQYRVADNPEERIALARNFIVGKIHNARRVLDRAMRDYPLRLPVEQIERAAARLSDAAREARACEDAAALLGIEGEAASEYFSVFDYLILRREGFAFHGRSRRPPLDPVNALLSFAYSLLTSQCAAALETVGLDPCVGFFHTDRAGRSSLALDLVEELRSVFADRFVLSLINLGILKEKSFQTKETGAVRLTDDGRREFLSHWQKKKQEQITHPYLKEKIEWGMVPFVQAQLLARHLRGDLEEYPPFLWK